MKNKPFNHPKLGGNVVDKANMPQRKPNKSMSGEELLKKGVSKLHPIKKDAIN